MHVEKASSSFAVHEYIVIVDCLEAIADVRPPFYGVAQEQVDSCCDSAACGLNFHQLWKDIVKPGLSIVSRYRVVPESEGLGPAVMSHPLVDSNLKRLLNSFDRPGFLEAFVFRVNGENGHFTIFERHEIKTDARILA